MPAESKDAEIERRVYKVVAHACGKTPSEVKGKLFVDDLSEDSLSIVEMSMSLEEEFNIEIKDDHLERIQTPEDFIRAVKTILVERG